MIKINFRFVRARTAAPGADTYHTTKSRSAHRGVATLPSHPRSIKLIAFSISQVLSSLFHNLYFLYNTILGTGYEAILSDSS